MAFPMKQYIEASHVKMLESAGARVIPIDFTLDLTDMKPLLEQINGLYIPGDSSRLVTPHQEYDYTKKVQAILSWAQHHNEKSDKHFPIFGIGYGMQAMIKSQTDDDLYMAEIAQGENLQINLAHEPQHTYMFDEYNHEELETLLDGIYLFSDVAYGYNMENFVRSEKKASTIFIPVASFNDNSFGNSNQETVAMIEGVVYPWFGVGYRLDRIQYNIDDVAMEGRLDQSRDAIAHAQKLANLFVDEARMSSNEFQFVQQELDALN